MANAMYYAAWFHLGVLNAHSSLGTLTIKRSGQPDLVITLGTMTRNDVDGVPSQFFVHGPINTIFSIQGNDPLLTTRYRHYAARQLGSQLALQLASAAATAGWTGTPDFVGTQFFESVAGVATAKYRLAASSLNNITTQYQFSTMAGALLFGAAGTGLSAAATTHDFPNIPYFVVKPTLQQVSAPSEEYSGLDYEPIGIASFVQSDNGMGYGNARLAAPKFRSWMQQYEVKARIYRQLAASANPWTFEHLFEHCRSIYPFYVAHGGFADANDYPVFMLRDDGNAHAPRAASIANHAQIHQPFRCVSIGTIAVPS